MGGARSVTEITAFIALSRSMQDSCKTYSTRKCKMSTLFSGHYLRNRSALVIGVLGYIGIVQHKEHSPEVLSIPPGIPCIWRYET